MTVDELAKIVVKLVDDVARHLENWTAASNALMLANSTLEKALSLQKMLIDRINILEKRVDELEEK